jgi:hypothetical protein
MRKAAERGALLGHASENASFSWYVRLAGCSLDGGLPPSEPSRDRSTTQARATARPQRPVHQRAVSR